MKNHRVKYTRQEYREEYLKSKEWQNLRSLVISAKCACQCCKESDATDVHHLVYRNLVDVTINDLIPVCRTCHNLIHEAIDNSYISQDVKDFENIKIKTINLFDDPVYKEWKTWITSKHFLSVEDIQLITELQPFVIKRIAGIIKKNIWYNDLPNVKFTGRQILKIQKIVKLGVQRKKDGLDRPRKLSEYQIDKIIRKKN